MLLWKKKRTPAVIWFTGLSGAGKSTIGEQMAKELKARGIDFEWLDGDSIRDIFPGTGFSKEERIKHIARVGHLASVLERHGVFVLATFVSPYEASRDFVRSICKNYVEVYVSTDLAECERRDVKGLYKKARKGEIQNFTGISDPYEVPTRPDLVINTQEVPVARAVRMILDRLKIR